MSSGGNIDPDLGSALISAYDQHFFDQRDANNARAAAKGGQVGHNVHAGKVDHAKSSGDKNDHITKSPDGEDGEWKTINGQHVWITSQGRVLPFPGSQGFGM